MRNKKSIRKIKRCRIISDDFWRHLISFLVTVFLLSMILAIWISIDMKLRTEIKCNTSKALLSGVNREGLK